MEAAMDLIALLISRKAINNFILQNLSRLGIEIAKYETVSNL